MYDKTCTDQSWPVKNKKVIKAGGQGNMDLPDFSQVTFLEYLVRFVTADDQVIPSILKYLH
jgi:hypothetical protein